MYLQSDSSSDKCSECNFIFCILTYVLNHWIFQILTLNPVIPADTCPLRACSVQLRQSEALRNKYAGLLFLPDAAPSRQEVNHQNNNMTSGYFSKENTPANLKKETNTRFFCWSFGREHFLLFLWHRPITAVASDYVIVVWIPRDTSCPTVPDDGSKPDQSRSSVVTYLVESRGETAKIYISSKYRFKIFLITSNPNQHQSW